MIPEAIPGPLPANLRTLLEGEYFPTATCRLPGDAVLRGRRGSACSPVYIRGVPFDTRCYGLDPAHVVVAGVIAAAVTFLALAALRWAWRSFR